jgi:hypothetical protein
MLGSAIDTVESEIVNNPSMFTMDYYRQKATQFQELMNALDITYRASITAIETESLDAETNSALQAFIDDYDSKKTWVKGAADGMNAASSIINSTGGRFPVLSAPQTLGIALPPIAVAAGALGVIAAITVWGRDAIKSVDGYLRRAQILDTASPEKRAILGQAMLEIDTANSEAENSILGQIAPIIKWGAIAIAAWMAYKAFEGRGK